MVDLIKLKLKTKNGVEIYISTEEAFDIVTITYDVHSGKKVYPFSTQLVSKDNEVTDSFLYVQEILSNFYMGYNNAESYYALNHLHQILHSKLVKITQQFPFLEDFEICELEFKILFNYPVTLENVEKKTELLFDKMYSCAAMWTPTDDIPKICAAVSIVTRLVKN